MFFVKLWDSFCLAIRSHLCLTYMIEYYHRTIYIYIYIYIYILLVSSLQDVEIRDELWGSVCKVLFGLLYCQKDYIISFKYFMSFFHITI